MGTLRLTRARTGRAATKPGKRDVFHVRKTSRSTLCGQYCSDWPDMEPREIEAIAADPNCCARCAQRVNDRRFW